MSLSRPTRLPAEQISIANIAIEAAISIEPMTRTALSLNWNRPTVPTSRPKRHLKKNKKCTLVYSHTRLGHSKFL
jgi:hypothetical protein